MSRPEEMWQCQFTNCGFIYDPARGDKKGKIPPGTRFEDIPEDWKCPCCGSSKKMFRPLAGPGSVAEQASHCPANPMIEEQEMQKYECGICGYVYDPTKGDPVGNVPANTSFERVPEDWVCPICGAGKDQFTPAP